MSNRVSLFVLGLFLLLGISFAWVDIGGGVCTCNSCADCDSALTDTVNCTKEVRVTADQASAASCIEVSGMSNKIFNCQGHYLDAQSVYLSKVMDFPSANNITVENCVLKNVYEGIFSMTIINSTFRNNTILYIVTSGEAIYVSGATNLTLDSNNVTVGHDDDSCDNVFAIGSSTDVHIIGNRISMYRYNVPTYVGAIAVWDSSNVTVAYNSLDDSRTAVALYGGSANLISYNNCTYSGIELESENSTVNGNRIQNGMLLVSGDRNTIANNTGNPVLFQIASSYNNLTNNTACNGNWGFIIQGTNNRLVNNTACNNLGGPSEDDPTLGSGFVVSADSNTLINNTANGNEGDGFYVSGTSNILFPRNNATGNLGHGFSFYKGGNVLSNATSQENGKFDIFMTFCTNTIENVTISAGRPFGYIRTPTNIVGGTYSELVLCRAGGSNVTGVTINGSNTLDNNGLLVVGGLGWTVIAYSTSSENYAGFYMIGSTAGTGQVAIGFSNASGNLFGFYGTGRNVYIVNNTGTSNNVSFYIDSRGSWLVNNTATNNDADGFQVAGNGTLVTGNTAYLNQQDGFLISGLNNIVENNTAEQNSRYGFHVLGNDNRLALNIANHSAMSGFYLYRVDNNVIDNNIVSEGGIGVLIEGNPPAETTNNTVMNNDIYNNGEGIRVSRDNENKLIGNKVHGISRDGIIISYSSGTNLTGNHLYDNGNDLMFQMLGRDDVTLDGVVLDNPAGDFTDYTNLSMYDSFSDGDATYRIRWSAEPASPPSGEISFHNKYITITQSAPSGHKIDEIVWRWSASEVGSVDESKLGLWEYSGGSWANLSDAVLDTVAHTLTINGLVASSEYGILEAVSPTPPTPGGGEEYECITSADCTGCKICQDHTCVLPDGSCNTATDCYSREGTPFICEECSCVAVECVDDTDCDEGYTCENNVCVPPECISDADCGEDEECVNFACTGKEKPEEEEEPGTGESGEQGEIPGQPPAEEKPPLVTPVEIGEEVIPLVQPEEAPKPPEAGGVWQTVTTAAAFLIGILVLGSLIYFLATKKKKKKVKGEEAED